MGLIMLNITTVFFAQSGGFTSLNFKSGLSRCVPRLLMFCLLSMPIQPLPAAEQVLGPAVPAAPVVNEIPPILAAKQHPYLTHADFSNRAEDMDALYKTGNYQALWLGTANAEKNIGEVLALLEAAGDHGLNPASYDVSTLKTKLPAALSLAPDAYKDRALYDTALSLSLVRFLHDLHYGRVNPHGINYHLKLREKKLIDLPVLITTNLAQNTLPSLPLQVEPKLQQYQKLKTALADYRQRAGNSVPFELAFKKAIRPGETIPQLQELHRFLVSTGDLPAQSTEISAEQSTRYSGEIVSAVKKFQQRHGLAADGIIGKGTAQAINEPIKQRITQIELAMERLRWLPELSAGPSIIVNIPAFQLWAFDDVDVLNTEMSNMRVVVGKAMQNQTPVLMAEMSFIDFMPYWNVPYNIVKNEILPKLLKNPGYLAKENMEMVSRSGVVGLNGSTLAQLKQGTVRVRQRPGKKNALGKVKFIFPNKEDVYLHDTPSSSLFSRSRRDFSHGCVRVADPEGLAEFALKDQWSKETIQKALHNPKTQRVVLKKPIPVLFFYTTAFFDHEDKLVFYPDIYGHDTVLLEALKNTEDLSDQAIFAAPSSPPVAAPKPSEGVAVETEAKAVETAAKPVKAGDQMQVMEQGEATKKVEEATVNTVEVTKLVEAAKPADVTKADETTKQ